METGVDASVEGIAVIVSDGAIVVAMVAPYVLSTDADVDDFEGLDCVDEVGVEVEVEVFVEVEVAVLVVLGDVVVVVDELEPSMS